MPKPRCWRGEQTRERTSRGARSAARVGAIAIQRMVHRKASAPSACAQSHASEGGAAFWHSAASRGEFFCPSPAAGEASKRESAPAAARGVQRALVRLRFSVWCIERHRHRRLVRKAAQAQVGPLSGTRAANRGDLGPSPAAGEAGSFDYGPAAARGRQRALVRLRFSVWCIERHRHRRLVRKATQAKAGPLSGTRLQAGVILAQAPLLARRANARARQLRHAECSARWCDCDSAYGA